MKVKSEASQSDSPVSSSLSSSEERLCRCFRCFLPLCSVRSSCQFLVRLKVCLDCLKLFKLPTSLGVSSSSTSSPETPKSSSSELKGGRERKNDGRQNLKALWHRCLPNAHLWVTLSHLLLIMKSSSLSAPVLSLSRSLTLRLFVVLAERVWLVTGRWISFSDNIEVISLDPHWSNLG